MELKDIAQEIRDIISVYQSKNKLTFIEETHTYFIKGKDGNITSDMPSVSTVLELFYKKFDSNFHSNRKAKGDKQEQKRLLKEWSDAGTYASHLGSRVHFLLEQELVNQYGSYKNVRQPIFDCDEQQIKDGDEMIKAGNNFIDLMHERKAVLLDTEIIMGNIEFSYFGQPDKMWLILDKNGNPGIVVSDWKSNKKKNMKKQFWTVPMLYPFNYLDDTALGHYKVQLPLYGKLFLKMLEGTKYENIPLLGCIIVHLTNEGEFKEYRVDKRTIDTIMTMDMKKYIK